MWLLTSWSLRHVLEVSDQDWRSRNSIGTFLKSFPYMNGINAFRKWCIVIRLLVFSCFACAVTLACGCFPQVARRIGRIFYMTSFPLALPLPPSALRPPDRDPLPSETRPPSSGSTSSPFSAPLACRASPKQENGNPPSAGSYDSTKALS